MDYKTWKSEAAGKLAAVKANRIAERTWRKLFIEGRAPDDAARRAEVEYQNSLPLIERRKDWLRTERQ